MLESEVAELGTVLPSTGFFLFPHTRFLVVLFVSLFRVTFSLTFRNAGIGDTRKKAGTDAKVRCHQLSVAEGKDAGRNSRSIEGAI